MGRVYNALAKADRLTDGQRPIGRPASADATPRQPDAETRRRGDAETFAAPPPVRRETTPAPAFDFATEEHLSSTETASDTLSSDFDQLFALSDVTGARRATEPVRPPTETGFVTPLAYALTPSPTESVAASPRRPVAASPFAEPRQIVNLKSLKIAPHIAAIAGGDALAAERYRTLAVRLSTLAARRKIKSIAVTSTEAGEGKSTVAASLAWTMARAGARRVLLLEATLRAASIHQLLGAQPTRGWLELSDAPAQLADAMLRIDPNGLYVMTAYGAAEEKRADDGALGEALMSSRFEKLLTTLAAHFDLIVIDAPALLDCAEAQQIAAIADATVIVTRAGRTPHRRVSEATDLVPQERRLGVILNECEVESNAVRRSGKHSLMSRLLRR
ncbi:MAG: tyrosine-protein kinase family protein [Blastocatellia bacterium]